GVNNNYNNPFYIHYDYTDFNGCAGKDSVQVEIHAQQTLTVSDNVELCRDGDNMTIDVTASYSNSTGLTWIPLSGGTVGDNRAENTDFTFTSRDDSTQLFLLYAKTDEGGGSVCPFDEATMQILVHPKPQFNITTDTSNGCNPVDVNFTTEITNYVDPATSSYTWTFTPDNATDNVQNPFYTFEEDGTNTAKLVVESAFGCKDSMEVNIDVYPIPTALFVPNPNNSTTAALPKFQFNNQSTVDPILNSSVDNFFWDFGIDSEIDDTSNEENPLFFYPADTGTYEVTLTVRTNYQCEATFKHDVIIGPDILVYIPNAFSPDGSGPGENDGFRAVVN
ncbi:MAG: PKD domain-containing protein, partial [Bacteroidia bacterium]|nr:PKD domain-containing protein [Bacteroidia bacterium]